MNSLQSVARPDHTTANNNPQAHQQISSPPQPQKSIQLATLLNHRNVAPRGMSQQPLPPRTLLCRMGIALMIPLAIWCAVHTASINTNPITSPCAGPSLTGYVLPPMTPAPAPGDWIGTFHDILEIRERNKTAARGTGRQASSRCPLNPQTTDTVAMRGTRQG